ncbi:TonB family protein [Pararhizobium mangrovi]|uniref:Protein TonB n=1 Tax=Pararhizobium mangrovi TaxID=2590452 RepID=A0A506UA00_9HYPH|nr:TonB family protein [Pararhizobium mangrovi]TPW29894.1 TonB family protein [Pararhizobium mangrovi]
MGVRPTGSRVLVATMAVAGSLVIHAAIVAAFISPPEPVRIAGGQPGELRVMDDALASIATATAEPVETTRPAERAPDEDAVVPDRRDETVNEPADARAVEASTPDAQQAEPADRTARPVRSEAADVAVASDEPVNEALEPSEQPLAPEAALPSSPVSNAAEREQAIQPEPEPGPHIDEVPLPVARPEYTPPKRDPEPQRRAERKETSEPARTTRKSRADSGRSSSSSASSRRSTTRSERRNTAAGNAAVSNYPGKIVSGLRRALRYPSSARSRRLRGEAHVRFTVLASGSVTNVRVVRSSGSSILDRAAAATVRRAAPFPDIPQAAGRSSWTFTVPLAFRP